MELVLPIEGLVCSSFFLFFCFFNLKYCIIYFSNSNNDIHKMNRINGFL